MVFDEDRQRTGRKPEPPEQRPVHHVPLRLAALGVGWTIALSIIAAAVVFPSRILSPIEHATRGLVETTWIVTGLSFLIVLALARSSGVRTQDLGLDRRAFRRASVATLATWAFVQAMLVIMAAASGELAWWRPWSLGTAFAQAFGNGPDEELVFRAILLVAIFHGLRRRQVAERTALGTALLGSTIVFVLSHAPSVVASGMSVHDASLFALKLTAMGLTLGLLYMATGNLWLVAWMHALDNVRPDIVDVKTSIKPYGVVALALVLVVRSVRSRAKSHHE